MAVLITDLCICCGACIDECPVEAIVDEDSNPDGEEAYYVYSNKCVECVSYNPVPACAKACPTEGCIVWSDKVPGMPFNPDISDEDRQNRKPAYE